ncbi:MAG: twin-arginine translocase subunit TatC [Thermomicrobiaceae bacterium]|nr:twin-arginine translocase subunit TatC [Thermomicrobiaceae bacterium]
MVSILDRMRGRAPMTAVPEPEPEEETFAEMTLQEHLEELRRRILYAAMAVALGFIAGLATAMKVLKLMGRMTGLEAFQVISPTEGFTTFMKVALYIGVGLAMPVIVYQLVRFLAPGLTRREKHYLYRALPFVSIMFVAGVAFAFFVVIPRALGFLSHFGGSVFHSDFRASEVVSFYMTLLLWVGVVFEMPVVIYILAKLGIVSAQRLASLRRYMLIGIMIAAAIITPTPDPFNMFLVAAPMYALYEIGILLARFA